MSETVSKTVSLEVTAPSVILPLRHRAGYHDIGMGVG